MTPQLFIVHVWNSEDTLALQDFYVGLCACVRARSCMPGMLVSLSQGSRRASGGSSPVRAAHISSRICVRAVFLSLAR